MIIIFGTALYFCLGGIGNILIAVIDLTLPFLLGYIFSLLTKPAAEFFRTKLKFPRQLAAIAVLVIAFGIIGTIITAVVLKLIDEARTFYMSFPDIIGNTQNLMMRFSDKWNIIYANLPDNIQRIVSDIGTGFSESLSDMLNSKSSPIMAKTGNLAKKLPGFFVGFIVFILSSYFLISDDGTVAQTVKKIIPSKAAESFRRVGDEVRRYLGGYIKAQLSIMCIVFVILLTGFYFIKADYILLAALIIAVVDAIPFFGTGIALIPWAIISFVSSDIKKGVGLLIIYLIVALTRQMIEPKILSSNIGMHPLATLMSMYAGYKFFSIGGMILGPVTLMLIISFYHAGVFDKPKAWVKSLVNGIKKEFRKG